MKEIESILALASKAGVQPLAMATVVNVRGSAYRRPGARMLITATGESVGMISVGCLEGDVREHALKVMASGLAKLITYDSTSSEDIIFGLGLGCNGIVQVLIEPINAHEPEGLLAFFSSCYEQRKRGSLVTVFQKDEQDIVTSIGWSLLCWPDGHVTSNNPATRPSLNDALIAAGSARFQVTQINLAAGATLSCLIETISPPTQLFVCGAGDDAMPLAKLATDMGMNVTVMDARSALTTRERFPKVTLVKTTKPENLGDLLEEVISPNALAMVMTHSYSQDKEWLRALLPKGLPYLGILGPKSRTQRLLDELHSEGCAEAHHGFARLHSPAGLDIGAESPEEVALSIIAEMKATLSERNGGKLRDRLGPIHNAVNPCIL